MDTFDTYEAAADDCPDGMTVCGTFDQDGTPVYFHMPEGVDDDTMRRRSFEIKYGKPMSRYQEFVMEQAEKMGMAGV